MFTVEGCWSVWNIFIIKSSSLDSDEVHKMLVEQPSYEAENKILTAFLLLTFGISYSESLLSNEFSSKFSILNFQALFQVTLAKKFEN